MVWKKLHVEVWFDPRLRLQEPAVRCLLADLMLMSDEHGIVQKATLGALCRLEELGVLLGLGFLEDHGTALQVVCVARDRAFSESRKAGGRARASARGDAEHDAQHDAEHGASTMLDKCAARVAASPSSGSGSSSEREGAGRERPKARCGTRIDPETYSLPEALSGPEFRAAFVSYNRTRKTGLWNEALAEERVRQMVAWGRERALRALRHSMGYDGLFEPSGSTVRPTSAPAATSRFPSRQEREARAEEEVREARALAARQQAAPRPLPPVT